MNRRAVIALVIALAILLLVFAAVGTCWSVRRAKRALLAPRETTVDIASVVTQVREMSRLETAAMHVVNVSTITQSYGVVPKSLANDELTLFAEGDVIAGIDLSRLKENDVWREPDGTLAMRLPEAQILISRVDNNKTRVITRTTGLLRRADPGLESRARQYAETNIRVEARKKGILTLASQNGEKKLANFLHTLGLQRVKFVNSATAPPAQR